MFQSVVLKIPNPKHRSETLKLLTDTFTDHKCTMKFEIHDLPKIRLIIIDSLIRSTKKKIDSYNSA